MKIKLFGETREYKPSMDYHEFITENTDAIYTDFEHSYEDNQSMLQEARSGDLDTIIEYGYNHKELYMDIMVELYQRRLEENLLHDKHNDIIQDDIKEEGIRERKQAMN